MTTDQAIKIINEQISSLILVTERTYDPWHTQTKSVIKDLFTVLSEEYSFISSFRYNSFYSDLSLTVQLHKATPTLIDFLKRCIVTIELSSYLNRPPVIQYIDRPVVKEVIKIKKSGRSSKRSFSRTQKVNAFVAFFDD